MLYPFMTLDDETEIVHSENYFENGTEQRWLSICRVYFAGI